ncbi:MAG: PH domain-containing protein [Planctomycetota bacterium]
MIEIICDACEQAFSVDDDQAGGKVPCPSCGDINRVPEGGPAAAAAPKGATAGEAEREIAIVRPAMFRAHPLRYALIVLLFAGGLVLCIGPFVTETMPPWLSWPGLALIVASLGWFCLWWVSTHWWVKLVISNKRTVRHEGIVRRHTTEVLHDHVRSVDIRQTFLQRIFSVGAIGIDSAGQEDIEIEIADIPKPYDVKRMIDQYRKM